eukprot:15150964-Alexandrium_andersonii.AAC.1
MSEPWLFHCCVAHPCPQHRRCAMLEHSPVSRRSRRSQYARWLPVAASRTRAAMKVTPQSELA